MKNLMILLIAVSTLFTSNILKAQSATAVETIEKEYRAFKMHDGTKYKGEVIERTKDEITVREKDGEEYILKTDEIKKSNRINRPRTAKNAKVDKDIRTIIGVAVTVIVVGFVTIINGFSAL